MEDLNNLLNGGEVPNLFPPDERLQVRDGPGVLWAQQFCMRTSTQIVQNASHLAQ